MAERYEGPLEEVTPCCWRIPKSYKPGMRVDGLIFADKHLIESIREDPAPEQVANVAFLPGIQRASLAMPDIHWGYGFPIGGVAATDPAEGGVISPGGVGYDINCGVRLMRSNLTFSEVQPHLETLVGELFHKIPTGVGRGGKYRFSHDELCRLMESGPRALIDRGLADERDIQFTEALGQIVDARPDYVSGRALERGTDQCGSIGAGNHFMEVQVVDRICDEEAARVMGLAKNVVCVMIHSGSRGLGYQVCDDSLRALRDVPARYGIDLPDRQLVCAPIDSPQGEQYLGAMRAAANFAWCNRQLLMWQAREVFETVFGRLWRDLELHLVYDVAHNIAKFEEHEIEGRKRRVWVHRKGATRAFPPHHPEVPTQYRVVGQPGSMQQTFGSACHGAGRRMSRTAAAKMAHGRDIERRLRDAGIVARGRSWKGLAEEQPDAYKDVDVVVDVVDKAGLAKKVARLRPIGVIKG